MKKKVFILSIILPAKKKHTKFNLPMYYIFLSAAFGMYFIEVLSGRLVIGITVCIILYTAWMLFAYFVIGKKSIAKEEKRINNIMNNLGQLARQLGDA